MWRLCATFDIAHGHGVLQFMSRRGVSAPINEEFLEAYDDSTGAKVRRVAVENLELGS